LETIVLGLVDLERVNQCRVSAISSIFDSLFSAISSRTVSMSIRVSGAHCAEWCDSSKLCSICRSASTCKFRVWGLGPWQPGPKHPPASLGSRLGLIKGSVFGNMTPGIHPQVWGSVIFRNAELGFDLQLSYGFELLRNVTSRGNRSEGEGLAASIAPHKGAHNLRLISNRPLILTAALAPDIAPLDSRAPKTVGL